MKIRVRNKARGRHVEEGSYDPNVAPKSEQWLSLSEAERLDAIVAYHDANRIQLPNQTAHAAIHAVVENQLAEGLPPVVAAYERLTREGLGRHETVHAIGMVVSDHIFKTVKTGSGVELDEYFRNLAELTAAKWRAV